MPCPSGYSFFNFTREDRRAQRKNESLDQREKRLAKLKEIEKEWSLHRKEKRIAKKRSSNKKVGI